jgi:UTP-glucose-1-phosphate uridylyltransferase
LQLIEEYERYNRLIVGLYPVALAEVSHFGIMTGVWEDKDERILNVSTVYEKPTANYAEEFLFVRNSMGQREYCSVFGQYILTPEVFQQLADDIKRADEEGTTREIELTSALEAVRSRTGMTGVRLYSQRFDMGNPVALVDTISKFSHL